MSRKRLLAAWLLMAGVIAGCPQEGDYLLHLVFVDAEAEALVSEVAVWVLQPGGHVCEELVSGQVVLAEMSVQAQLTIPYPPAGELSLTRVPSGEMLFFAEGRTAEGGRILRGCTPARVKGGSTVEVTVQLDWVCRPDPAGEIPNNGIDDDCDGLTDNCSEDDTCDDFNVCTSDFCFGQECRHTDLPEGLPCNDHDPCTIDDQCRGGTCQGLAKDCSAYDGTCLVGVCDAQTAQCVAQAAEDGIECLDGRFCTINDRCLAGECIGDNQDCADSDPCTRDVCNDAVDECQNTLEPVPGAEGTAVPDSCQNGLDDDCDGFTDLLDPNCVDCGEDADCDDSNDCTEDTCVDLQCRNLILDDGTSCNDGLFCTSSDACQAGVCRGEPRDCSSLDGVCQEGVCSELEGECQVQPLQDGTACQDALFCTIGENCSAGQCQGSGRDCSDTDICTRDECNEGLDRCDHILEPNPGAEGPPGDASCKNLIDDDCDGLTDQDDGSCSGCANDAECDDDNPCTDDSCDLEGECQNPTVQDGSECDDGLYCSDPDACTQGVCGGPARDCADSDVCTLDECNEDGDVCQNTWQPQPDVPDLCQDGLDQNCDGLADECCLGDGSFAPTESFSVGDGPFSVAVGDFDADQILDLIIPVYNTSLVGVFLGNGVDGQADGTFNASFSYATSQNPLYVAVGDFNSDHIQDLAITAGGTAPGDRLKIMFGSGGGGQGNGEFIPGPAVGDIDEAQNLRVGDFDSDGISDLAVADFVAGGVRIFLGRDTDGQANGTFSGGLLYATGDGAYDLEVADFDGDRILDLAVSNRNADSFSILKGQGQNGRGDGTFTLLDSYPIGLGVAPTGIALGDFNSDHIHDLVVTTFNQTRLKIYLGDGLDGQGDGTFSAGEDYWLEGAGWSYVEVADLNGDGVQDLISVNTVGDNVLVLPGNGSDGRGDGTFDTGALYTVGAGSRAPAIGDFNSDNILDLLVPYQEQDNATLFLGSGSGSRPDGTFAPRSDYSLSGPGEVLAVGDFNSDKIQDLAVYALGAAQPVVEIFLGGGSDGRGDGTFSMHSSQVTGDVNHLLVEDLDLDGIQDLLVLNHYSNTLGILFGQGQGGQGNGTFQSMVEYDAGGIPFAMASGDFNRDGIVDLAVVNIDPDTVGIKLGELTIQGEYRLIDGQDYQVGIDPYWVCAADFDEDAITDLAVANPVNNSFSVLIGNGGGGQGDGTFQQAVDEPTVSTAVALLCQDFNSDGTADVLVVGYLTSSISFHPGLGNGSFGQASTYPVDNFAMRAQAADFDGDGILDLAVANLSLNSFSVMKGGGQDGKADGSFTQIANYPVDSSQVHLATGDFNSDGIVDLAVPSDSAATFGILLGQAHCLSW